MASHISRSALQTLFLGCLLALGAPAAAWAQRCDPPVATAVSVQGSIEVRESGATDWTPVQLNDAFCAGDTLRAGRRSRANVSLAGESVLRIRAGTEMTFEGQPDGETHVINMLKGAAHLLSRSGAGRLDVNTPFTVAGVRGTEFLVESGDDEAVVTVFEGRVLARNSAGSVTLSSGQTAVARAGQAPVLRTVAKPRDATQWALYYPPVMYPDPSQFRDGADVQDRIRRSSDFFVKGDVREALASLDGVDEDAVQDPRFFAYRASLLLAVGSVDEARTELDRAFALQGPHSDALALQTIIAITTNDNAGALALAQRAVAEDPDSATAQLALSYARQAQFDLQGARASIEKATELEPANALAWARLAELESSFGRLRHARRAAEMASELEPELARTKTVLGFAQLANVDVDEAKVSFERAIALDQGDPLPRLGLGLAKIRAGDLDGGGRDIEVAASLDSSNSLVRSYLGKTYFEEKRTGLDRREFEVAKQLDPNDPTPWFYDAIALQTTNRPVEALRANQEAIALNDNRAVFRSRLLLDSDLAARSAALGRIYSDLGFQNLALVEGWNSVNTDPSNFSAHRLLADSYAALPRHEIARVSELYQSQMLQSNNITPIQPALAESNLFLLSGQGAANSSFNEFNPMFNRNRVALQATGLGAEDGTWGAEGILSGIYDRASFSGGYSGFGTDGFRFNNDQRDDVGNVFGQYEISSETSVQTEFRYRSIDNGDLELRFLDDDFRPVVREETERWNVRGGVRHAFSPGSILLASYQHSDEEGTLEDTPPAMFGAPPFLRSFDNAGNSGEVQHLFRSEELGWLGGAIRRINVTSGGGYFHIDGNTELAFDIFGDGNFMTVSSSDIDSNHGNVYLYSHILLPRDITLTLGVSGDFFGSDAPSRDRNQGNPKVGLTWNLPWVRGLTLRAAAFRVLKRTLLNNQTLEPTQVAGFNQFFDDFNSTEAWRYGGAIDYAITESIFIGGEFSKRDLSVLRTAIDAGPPPASVTFRTDWDEYQGRTYAFWTPHEWVSLSAEYRYEKLERGNVEPFQFEKVTSHWVPLGVRLFHPSGVSFGFTSTYLEQDGIFVNRQAGNVLTPGDDSRWLLDLALNYRLPKRYGFVSFGVTDMLDDRSSYQATDPRNPAFVPGRRIFGRVTLALP